MTIQNKPFKSICIEGMDGAGKNTQTNLLVQVLKRRGENTVSVSFPNYESLSSYPVTEIIRNDNIHNYEDNLKYIKCSAFAMDRAMTIFNKEDTRIYNIIKTGGTLVFDRYTTSNMLHVASILDSVKEVDECIQFIQELEYERFKLPKPDHVFFLDLHPDVSLQNIEKRGRVKDIHETPEHLYKVYERSNYIVDKLGWTRIECNNSNLTMKSPLEIHFNICKHLHIA